MSDPLTFEGLGTTWWVEIFDTVSNERRYETEGLITALVRSIENRFSRFQANSLVSILNTTHHLVDTDTDLRTLISLGQTFYQQTNGVFNCLLGEHLEARGYDATYSFRPRTAPTHIPNPTTDILVTPDTITLTAGKLDCGGYGKGWAIDCVADVLVRAGIKEFLINAGGDMYGTSENGEPITIYLEHPTTPGQHLGSTTLWHQGFAASSRTKRRWQYHSHSYSHIIDTDTTETLPEEVAAGVFIKAPRAVTADAFATTGLIAQPATLFALAAVHSLAVAVYTEPDATLITNSAFGHSLPHQ